MATKAADGGERANVEADAVPGVGALVILVAGMAAAWIAAGSTGLLGHALQHALTWCALAVALAAALPLKTRSLAGCAIPAGAVLCGLLLGTSISPAVGVLGVAVVLGSIAVVTHGLTARIALIVAFGALSLGIVHFAYASVPMVWLAANFKGQLLGRIIGSSSEIGATFAGLDFLVLTAAVYIGWLLCTAPPRRSRATWAAAAILGMHLAYLAIVANWKSILDALPSPVVRPESDLNNVGVWTWGDGLRTLIPWNLPLVALAGYLIIALAMFRRATWLPVVARERSEREQEELSDKALLADMLLQFGPVLLAVAAPLMLLLSRGSTDLVGKKVLAYDSGGSDWRKPQQSSSETGPYGMLPTFVESLGGAFSTSKDLTEQELGSADVLLVVQSSDRPWASETLNRVWRFVDRGGSLVLAGKAGSNKNVSTAAPKEIFQPVRLRDDTVIAPDGAGVESREVGVEPLAIFREAGSSLDVHWPAKPIVVRRWATNGTQLGDLVIAAEQSLGQGRVLVLGSDAAFRDKTFPQSYPFVGRLLTRLAHSSSDGQIWWRQCLGLAAIAAMVSLLVLRPSAWQVVASSAALSFSLILCSSSVAAANRVLPDGRSHGDDRANNIAYIDASHLESYDSDLNANKGLGRFTKTLMRQGYLPLLTRDLTPQRLQRASILVLIAPLRQFSQAELDTVKQFVAGGGTLLCMVGAEEARAGAPLLAEFGFTVPPSPVPARERGAEPEPLGKNNTRVGNSDKQVSFWAAWPVECERADAVRWSVWSEEGKPERPVIISAREGQGAVVVIGDTHFAANENLDAAGSAADDFWRWLLSHAVPGQEPWNPPEKEKAAR